MRYFLILVLLFTCANSFGKNFFNSTISDESLKLEESSFFSRATVKDSLIFSSEKIDFLNTYLLDSSVINSTSKDIGFTASSLTFFQLQDIRNKRISLRNTYWNYGKLLNVDVENLLIELSHIKAIYIKNLNSSLFSLLRSTIYLTEFRNSKLLEINFQNIKINKSTFIDVSLVSGKMYKGSMSGGKWNISHFENIKLSHFKFNNVEFKGNEISNNSHLVHVHFNGSDLESTQFKNTKLENVIFNKVNSLGLTFTDCELRNVNFVGVKMGLIEFENTNLYKVFVDGKPYKPSVN
ncbi:hypothetical protein A9Q84_20205 [Halobacteriovorax marinus]|uniref:Uncharacterized protein n=1 Tax=Halobacteriovorax marinus TaxID=97084 RepID=A0A1Y5F122_9BACT|nr:hypothetical protein A9Q84_20205 [Halobacteriovorax marinus]